MRRYKLKKINFDKVITYLFIMIGLAVGILVMANQIKSLVIQDSIETRDKQFTAEAKAMLKEYIDTKKAK